MLKVSKDNIEVIKEEVYKDSFINICRINENNFIRKRKIIPRDIILYELNKKGLSTKMEIINFNNINYVQDVSSPALFKQREKLNPYAFTYLNQILIKNVYTNHTDEVETYKGYLLLAIDGSDFEIPNTPITREKYNGKQQDQCAKVTVSTCYDILNKYTLDTIVEKYDYSEITMANDHLNTIKDNKLVGNFKTIIIADRNYRSLDFFYNSIKNNEKFLVRVSEKNYREEKNKMIGNDDIIEIKNRNGRMYRYKDTNPELYNYLSNGNSIKIRCIKTELETGEIEYLFTNLDYEIFSTEEIIKLYNYRWKIEVNYKHLKNHLKIECITSGKEILIKQDIYSQILVSNMLQGFINENNKNLQNCKHKNIVKTNDNIAVGVFKNTLIYILLEQNANKRNEMMEKFNKIIEKHYVPIKPDRKYPRIGNAANRHHINQRKSF